MWIGATTAIGVVVRKFDPVIDALDKFEDIRCPERILENGMLATFQFGKQTPIVRESEAAKVPQFTPFVGGIDVIVKAICDASNVAANVATRRYREPGPTYLKYENAETNLFD